MLSQAMSCHGRLPFFRFLNNNSHVMYVVGFVRKTSVLRIGGKGPVFAFFPPPQNLGGYSSIKMTGVLVATFRGFNSWVGTS